MGLGFVEFIMDVEDHFGIQIPNESIDHVKTLGDFSVYVCGRLKARAGFEGVCLSARAFYQTRKGLGLAGGIDPKTIRPDTQISQVLSGEGLYQKWIKLIREIRSIENLVLPRWAKLMMWVCVAGWMGMVVLGKPWPDFFCRVVVLILGVPAQIWILDLLRMKFGEIPAKYTTAGQMSRVLIPRLELEKRKSAEKWSDEEVWLEIRNIVAESQGKKPDSIQREMRVSNLD